MVCTHIGCCLNSLSAKKLYLQHDQDNQDSWHYNVITNLKGAVAKSTYVTVLTRYR